MALALKGQWLVSVSMTPEIQQPRELKSRGGYMLQEYENFWPATIGVCEPSEQRSAGKKKSSLPPHSSLTSRSSNLMQATELTLKSYRKKWRGMNIILIAYDHNNHYRQCECGVHHNEWGSCSVNFVTFKTVQPAAHVPSTVPFHFLCQIRSCYVNVRNSLE